MLWKKNMFKIVLFIQFKVFEYIVTQFYILLSIVLDISDASAI